jgi:streptogramin lyase
MIPAGRGPVIGYSGMVPRRTKQALDTGALTALLFLLPVATASWAAIPPGPVVQDPVTSFRLPHAPSQAGPIFPAPDGSLWFGAANGVPGEARRYVLAVERISPAGEISQIADHLGAEGFAKTADGSVWFTGSRYIGRFGPDGSLTKFPMPETESSFSYSYGEIVVGADGNLWFSGSHSPPAGKEGASAITVDRMTPTGQVTEFDLPGIKGLVTHIAAGPDGNIWFTSINKVGRISTAGQITEFQLPQYHMPFRMAAGPDGNVWFTEEVPNGSAIGRVTPAGEITEFPLPTQEGAYAVAIAPGPDGRLWFSYGPGVIGRIATDGALLWEPLPDPTAVGSIAAGNEGNVWYTAAPEPPCAANDEACRLAPPTAAAIVGRVELPVPAALAVRVGAVRTVRGGRAAKVRLSCMGGKPGDACHGQIRLRSGGVAIGRREFALATGASRGFTLALTKKVRTKLLDKGKLRILCTATVDGGRAQSRTSRLHVHRRRSRKHPKHPAAKKGSAQTPAMRTSVRRMLLPEGSRKPESIP